MRWKKFRKLQAQYPFLEHDLGWGCVLPKIKKFVRTKVDYIAFRPFDELELNAKPVSTGTPLQSDYVHVKMVEYYKTVDYHLIFHIEGEEQGARLRYVTDQIGDGSIQAHIDDVTKWFEGCELFRGKKLIWERVIKQATSGSTLMGMSNMSLEIYEFPPTLNPAQQKVA